jgi:hypothetical protein
MEPNWEELSKTLSDDELQMMKDLYQKLFTLLQNEQDQSTGST